MRGRRSIKKDRGYAQFDKEVKERITQLNERIASRGVALSASNGKTRLSDAIADGRAKLEVAKTPEATDAEVDAAAKSVEALMQAIEMSAALEKQDKSYATSAERARGELLRLTEAVEAAKAARSLRKETGEALAAGVGAVEAAGSAGALRKKKELYDKALLQFRGCAKDGPERLRENPALAKVVVLVNGNPSTAKDVAEMCEEQTKATEQLSLHVMAMIAFDEGPKRAFETAKGLLAKNKKTEALPQFDECVSTGLYAQYKFPELKEGKFEVAGGSMTMAELVGQCVSNRKAILGK